MTDHGPHRRVPYRREREKRTDYYYRRSLLRSGRPRFIARHSLKNVRAQVATPSSEGDEILASAYSGELSKWNWRGYKSNTPAAYLVGLLCGYRAKETGVNECILDIDRYVASPQAKIFAILKGGVEAGLDIPHKKRILPSEERCKGEHISNYAQKLKSEEEEKYKSQFSSYIRRDLPPEDLPDHFKKVKEAIQTEYGE
ncbi:hypothetical protein AKJ51_04670 [candidate division MSBL1 archaeon SCGC-AAA382A20]|uniref:Large ribosomal subunit protein uL18 n=1 Tax=candidate division MSBL1 archaeon SCGC-AAA382A20 TaxID=1698280 RepID=A0A133VHD2_9EURY|nr:hypothetical protein AKJ51_04670 [candidate division MSBL1 archaeon SCGC-AAA382A20]